MKVPTGTEEDTVVQKHTLIDPYGRMLNYLRVSVTDRCNLNCIYCRGTGDDSSFFPSTILSYEEILRVVRVGAQSGIDKVRVTGGEPLVRRDFSSFMERLMKIPGLRDVSVTTNGIRLANFLQAFKKMGISRLNISLDSLDPKTYARITGFDGFSTVWKNLHAAMDMGFSPLKINVVVLRGINDHEISDFADLTCHYPLSVRFIEYMPLDPHFDVSKQMLGPEIEARLQERGPLLPVESEDSSFNAQRFRYKNARGEVGLIRPVSNHFCRLCNRLRLTADGKLRSCLLSRKELDIRSSIYKSSDDEFIAKKFLQAAQLKPRCHSMTVDHETVGPRGMSAIGG